MAHANIKYLTLIPLLSILSSCFCQNKKNNDENNDEMKIPIIIKMQDNNWKKDSLGCLCLRTLELADSLIVANKLLEKSISEFIDVFGEPNEVIERNTKKSLIYYMDTFCKDGKLIEDIDKSWVIFDFENNILIEIPTDRYIE